MTSFSQSFLIKKCCHFRGIAGIAQSQTDPDVSQAISQIRVQNQETDHIWLNSFTGHPHWPRDVGDIWTGSIRYDEFKSVGLPDITYKCI